MKKTFSYRLDAKTKEAEQGKTVTTIDPEKIKQEGAFENFELSAETIAQLKASGVNYLFQVQSKTFTDVFSGTDVIVKASKCTFIHSWGMWEEGVGKVWRKGVEGVEEGRIVEEGEVEGGGGWRNGEWWRRGEEGDVG
ncbi:putative nucleolar RNA helicase 2 [Apostichopus japonicus]|uniref:Putative nucleolar RNA helicase 2 n=1 Tax=Stichopus japonicus TaxID=307972 RepID=A0A2G8KBT7_STIJA|nr:putative nucleolar RNA helicase 2 [Apostichopus japonicus]